MFRNKVLVVLLVPGQLNCSPHTCGDAQLKNGLAFPGVYLWNSIRLALVTWWTCDVICCRPGLAYCSWSHALLMCLFLTIAHLIAYVSRTELKSLSYERREEYHGPGLLSHFPHLCQFSLILAPLICGIVENSLWFCIYFWQSLPSCEIKPSILESQCMIQSTFINKSEWNNFICSSSFNSITTPFL